MEILSIALNEINPAPYNPRKDLQPGDPEYDKLKKSILEFDMVEPLVWNKQTGNLVGGHQRLKVLKELGVDKVEVSVVDLSPVKEKALNIALNKIQGAWDFPKLKDLLEELDTGGFDIEITGFDDKEIEELMTQFHVPAEGLTDDDEIPEKVETVCKTSDVWQLGNHRLLCGDATKKQDVERLMGGEKADMVFTDPPYGIGYLPDSKLKKLGKLENDNRDGRWENFEQFSEFLNASLTMLVAFMKEGAAYYICMGWEHLPDILKSMQENNARCYSVIVWDRMMPRITSYPQDYIPVCEFITYGWKRGENRQRPSKGSEQTTIWRFKTEKSADMVHPTQKPIAVMENALLNSCIVNDSTLDIFGGSGSILIACEKLDRRCFMMEIDEHYCDVIIQRWQDFTGKQAEKINGE